MNRVIILIPTYNEAENIAHLIEALFNLSDEVDILIIDDNSPDGTGQIVTSLHKQYNTNRTRLALLTREKKEGLGKAYIDGFKHVLEKAHYDFICTMDADFSHNPKDVFKLISIARKEQLDLTVGSRYLTGINVVNWPIKRVLLSWFASKYVQIITSMPIHDATAGFNCYSRKAIHSLDLSKIRFVGYAFQIEIKYKLWKKGLAFKEVPIIFVNRSKGISKMDNKIFFEALIGVISLRMKG